MRDLVSLLGDDTRFRATISQALPDPQDLARLLPDVVTKPGGHHRECCCFLCQGDDDQAIAEWDGQPWTVVNARRCLDCNEPLIGVYAWDEQLCPNCVTMIPAQPGESPTGFETVGSPNITHTVVLRLAARYLERHGWIQGAYYDATTGVFTPPADMAGAIGMVCYGGPVDAPSQHFDDPGFLDFEQAVLHLDRWLLVHDGTQSYEFNDAHGRRVEDVIAVLREAASTPADELIDALRAGTRLPLAIERCLVPTGKAGDQPTAEQPSEHVDYPHQPGTLYDCPACEASCFCASGVLCVHCALLAEKDSDGSHCLFCGAPGGYPYCQRSQGPMSCLDVVTGENAERAAQGGDGQ
ncbi:DUF6197 family protein [Paractinoplanes atraurantiacus]|uniref:DUF6197 family protein n=1 Tax=Paractinoplanes atraurantiacus TaxID=1036182 RepID=UPI0011787CFC|nr:hypothetical protein [Actinoplanes atraurantiacus]